MLPFYKACPMWHAFSLVRPILTRGFPEKRCEAVSVRVIPVTNATLAYVQSVGRSRVNPA